MKRRRLLALLTSVTLLHLSVLTGDSACAWHAMDGHHFDVAAGEEQDGHAAPAHGHVVPAPEGERNAVASAPTAVAPDAPPCEAPARQLCCETLVGCGASAAVASTRPGLASVVVSAALLREPLHDAPASFASAPEPPPPKR
jgi:hypothetical protein